MRQGKGRGGGGLDTKEERGKKQMQKQKETRQESAWLRNRRGRKQTWECGGNGEEVLASSSHFRCRGNLSAACVASAQQCASGSPGPGDKQGQKDSNYQGNHHTQGDTFVTKMG